MTVMRRSLRVVAILAVGAAMGVGLSLPLQQTIPEEVQPRPSTADPDPVATEPTQSPAVTAPVTPRLPLQRAMVDDLQQDVIEELRVFTDWLEENDADGYIGEVGWPSGEHHGEWNRLADAWFREANAAQLWVSAWAAGSLWPSDYDYLMYELDDEEAEPLSLPNSQAWVLELHLGTADYRRGVNVAGAEFGAPGSLDDRTEFSNEQPGLPDEAYRYPDVATFEALAERGFDSVRLPFRWERIQPTLDAPLDSEELERLTAAVDEAARAGLDVILDLHNYGSYWLAEEDGSGIRRPIGGDFVTLADFVDLWSRLGEEFAHHEGVLAYGLMNEPANLAPAAGLEPAQVWERASQQVVDELRAKGDDTLIMISGYNWSHVRDWSQYHPEAWISDPADNHRYEAHHYWQGEYTETYDQALQEANGRE